jgi:hypothetical protein
MDALILETETIKIIKRDWRSFDVEVRDATGLLYDSLLGCFSFNNLADAKAFASRLKGE